MTYCGSVFVSGQMFSVRAALSLHFLCPPLSFVGNTEIDVDIKKYYCRAGIKSIQVCLQGCSGLFGATEHCCSRHRREAERLSNHLICAPFRILCGLLSRRVLETSQRDLGSVAAESCIHKIDKTVKLNGIKPSSTRPLEGTPCSQTESPSSPVLGPLRWPLTSPNTLLHNVLTQG